MNDTVLLNIVYILIGVGFTLFIKWQKNHTNRSVIVLYMMKNKAGYRIWKKRCKKILGSYLKMIITNTEIMVLLVSFRIRLFIVTYFGRGKNIFLLRFCVFLQYFYYWGK